VKEILLNRLQVRNCERVADEGEGGAVTFDSKKAKVKRENTETESERFNTKRKQENIRKGA
jgi:hypothetical protein